MEGIDHLRRTKLMPTIVIQRLITLYYYEFTKDFRFDGEKHDFWEFLYVDRGEIEIGADDKRHVLGQGQIIFHKPNEFHRFHAAKGVAPNVIVITFDCDSPAMRAFEDQVLSLNEQERDLLVQIMNEGKNSFAFPFAYPLVKLKKPKLGSQQLLHRYLEIFLIVLLRKLEQSRTPQAFGPVSRINGEAKLYRQIDGYIEQHLQEKLSVAALCDQFYVSRTALQGMFRKHAGVTVMDYVTKLRIGKAKSYIREEAFNFTEIANRLGFAGIHYFSKSFKKETGMSPSEYARSVKAMMSE